MNWDGIQYADKDADNEVKGCVFIFKPSATGGTSKYLADNGVRNTAREQVSEILEAYGKMENFKLIFTMANADNGGEEINQSLTDYAAHNSERCLFVSSLGSVRYLSALKYCSFVMGNSSSGLIEAPSFGVPTINIGDRQKGRIKADSVIDCKPEREDIFRAMEKALSDDFREKCRHIVNAHGDGRTSEKIVAHIKAYCSSHRIDMKKSFYNLAAIKEMFK